MHISFIGSSSWSLLGGGSRDYFKKSRSARSPSKAKREARSPENGKLAARTTEEIWKRWSRTRNDWRTWRRIKLYRYITDSRAKLVSALRCGPNGTKTLGGVLWWLLLPFAYTLSQEGLWLTTRATGANTKVIGNKDAALLRRFTAHFAC